MFKDRSLAVTAKVTTPDRRAFPLVKWIIETGVTKPGAEITVNDSAIHVKGATVPIFC